MKIGVIGDDFTGSSDAANTLARAGARTLQYGGVPEADAEPGIDAAVIALKTRSTPAADAVAQSLAACRWLVAQGAEQIAFKYCSTFDSTREGNIGPVAEALLAELGADLALVCPAFPATGRTIYQGHLFVHDRLLSESGMERHPLTPMTDPDLRRWLGLQTRLAVGHLPIAAVRADPDAALARLAADGVRLVVADAIDDTDLLRLGRAARGHRLVTGGSGILLGLPANFGIEPGQAAAFPGRAGPALVVAGSCSAATLRQVAAYAAGHPTLRLSAGDALEPEAGLARAIAFVAANRDGAPMVTSSDAPEAVAAAQAAHGRERLAEGYEAIFAGLAAAAVERGVTRIVAAGGETSGAVAGALGKVAFEIGPEIDPGVPALSTGRLALALKSGNFGADDFLARALRVLEGRP
jgi:uncharacterized protein YgbK (DUF1537 family)